MIKLDEMQYIPKEIFCDKIYDFVKQLRKENEYDQKLTEVGIDTINYTNEIINPLHDIILSCLASMFNMSVEDIFELVFEIMLNDKHDARINGFTIETPEDLWDYYTMNIWNE